MVQNLESPRLSGRVDSTVLPGAGSCRRGTLSPSHGLILIELGPRSCSRPFCLKLFKMPIVICEVQIFILQITVFYFAN